MENRFSTLQEIADEFGLNRLITFIRGRHCNRISPDSNIREIDNALAWNKVDAEDVIADFNNLDDSGAIYDWL